MTPEIVAELNPPRLPADFVGTGWADLLAAFGLGLLLAALAAMLIGPMLRPRRRRESVAARLARLGALPPDDRLLGQLRLLDGDRRRASARDPRRALRAHAARPGGARRPDPPAQRNGDAMVDFALPLAFLLLPLPFLVRLLPPRGAGGQPLYLPPAIAAGAGSAASGRLDRPGLILAAFWLCLVTAVAGPQRLVPVPDRTASGRDIVLTLDLSGSMAIEDFSLDGETASRLDAVKRVATGFVEARRGDRIGAVIFADRAYVAAPLTYDLTAVARAIDSAEIGLTGRSTAISDGLGLALKRILADPASSRVIVLLSDGRDTAARLDPRQVARLAAENGVRVHTIALGPEDLEERPASRDAVDITTLREIAATSGGRTWRVRDMDDLTAMAAELDRLEPNPSGRPPLIQERPLWMWPAAFALGLGLAVAWRRA